VGRLWHLRSRYLRVVDHFSMSQYAAVPAKERKVCPGRAAAEGFRAGHTFLVGRVEIKSQSRGCIGGCALAYSHLYRDVHSL